VQTIANLAQVGKQLFPGIQDQFAAAAAASTMFDAVRVKWVQTALNALGTVPALDVDGEYGPLTTAAVKQFQTSKRSKLTAGRETSLTRRSRLQSPR
jgi:peptidoglycan hydrolase-like protein with peptidoglycan-binding domain